MSVCSSGLAVHALAGPCACIGPQARMSQAVDAGHCVQVVKGKRPTVDLLLRGASAAAAPESEAVAPGALLCGLVTDVSGALCGDWHCSNARASADCDVKPGCCQDHAELAGKGGCKHMCQLRCSPPLGPRDVCKRANKCLHTSLAALTLGWCARPRRDRAAAGPRVRLRHANRPARHVGSGRAGRPAGGRVRALPRAGPGSAAGRRRRGAARRRRGRRQGRRCSRQRCAPNGKTMDEIFGLGTRVCCQLSITPLVDTGAPHEKAHKSCASTMQVLGLSVTC